MSKSSPGIIMNISENAADTQGNGWVGRSESVWLLYGYESTFIVLYMLGGPAVERKGAARGPHGRRRASPW